MKLKVREAEFWMKWDKFKFAKDDLNFLKEIKPIFNRNGYYLRDNKYCWFEWNNKAWEYDAEQFKYELDLMNCYWFRKRELEATLTLIKNKIAPKELIQKYYNFRNMIESRKVYRDTRKFMLSYTKE